MRADTIPNYEIGSRIEVDIHSKSHVEALRDLEAHQALCPGDYRPKEACNSKHNEAWRKWAARKNDLLSAVEVACTVESRPKVSLTVPRSFDPGSARVIRKDRKDAAYYAEQLRRKVMEMAGMVPNSDEWQRARASAQNYRLKCQGRAALDRVPVPELPAIPTVPIEMNGRGRVATHEDPRHVAERERKARLKARKMEAAS